MLESLNRSVLILKPKQPYIDFSGYDASQESWALLVPELQDGEECVAYIRQKSRFTRHFKDALEDTGKAESTYPDITSIDVFLEWFEIEYHGLVFDCADDFLPVGPAKFDLYYRKGTPNWYIGSSGKLNEREWTYLRNLPTFKGFEPGYSNQWDEEKKGK